MFCPDSSLEQLKRFKLQREKRRNFGQKRSVTVASRSDLSKICTNGKNLPKNSRHTEDKTGQFIHHLKAKCLKIHLAKFEGLTRILNAIFGHFSRLVEKQEKTLARRRPRLFHVRLELDFRLENLDFLLPFSSNSLNF